MKDALKSEDPSLRVLAARALLPVATVEELTAFHEYAASYPNDDEATVQAVRRAAAALEEALALPEKGPLALQSETNVVEYRNIRVKPEATGPRVVTDIRYGPEERQVLDVYAPAAAKGLPVVFWIHGGGWQAGDKSDVGVKPAMFTDRGFVFVSTGYRLLPKVVDWIARGDLDLGPPLRFHRRVRTDVNMPCLPSFED